MRKRLLGLDERGNIIFRQISTILYIITLYALIGFQLYRQFVLHQPMSEWNDIAILIAFNVIGLLGAILYVSGTVHPKVLSIRTFLLGFSAFVLLGVAFTLFKYSVLLGQTLGMVQILDIFFTVLKISAVLFAFLGLLAYLGYKRMEKRIQ